MELGAALFESACLITKSGARSFNMYAENPVVTNLSALSLRV